MTYATESRFLETCSRIGIDGDRASFVWENLHRCYSETHRHYHNFSHIDRMLAHLDRVASGAVSLELAIWFHDAVYDPQAADNEVQSATFFEEQLATEVPESLAAEVCRLILATDLKCPRSGRPDEQLLIDIDLSILGSAPGEYEKYRKAIREEYFVYPDREFSKGRLAVLEHFLSNPIFVTESFAHFEQRARANLQAEREFLANSLR